MGQTSWCWDEPQWHISQPQVIKVNNTVYGVLLKDQRGKAFGIAHFTPRRTGAKVWSSSFWCTSGDESVKSDLSV